MNSEWKRKFKRNKTWKFPRLARGFIYRTSDWQVGRQRVRFSLLTSRMLRRNGAVFKQSIDVLNCLLRANLYSDVHPFKDENLIVSDIVWRTRRVISIEDARDLKVTFEGKISPQQCFQGTVWAWMTLHRFILFKFSSDDIGNLSAFLPLTGAEYGIFSVLIIDKTSIMSAFANESDFWSSLRDHQ